MFELIGKARNRRAKRAGTHVHTSCISVAEDFRNLLTLAREMEEGPAPEPDPLEKEWCSHHANDDRGEREAIHWQWHHGEREYKAKARDRPATWRELMDQLDFGDWLHLMMGRAQAGFNFRLKWIKEHNPTCLLVDMTGKCVAKQESYQLDQE